MANVNYFPAHTPEQEFWCNEIAEVINKNATYIDLPANTALLYMKSPLSTFGGYVKADTNCRCFVDQYSPGYGCFTLVTDEPWDENDEWNHFRITQTYDPVPPEELTTSWRGHTVGPIDGKYYGVYASNGHGLDDFKHMAMPIVGDGSGQKTMYESAMLTYGPSAIPPIGEVPDL